VFGLKWGVRFVVGPKIRPKVGADFQISDYWHRLLGLGVYQVFPIGQPPHHSVWRMMAEDTYAMAMEPSTNRDAGRWDAKERGELLYMEPGEIRTYDLEIGTLVGEEAIDGLAARLEKLVPAGK